MSSYPPGEVGYPPPNQPQQPPAPTNQFAILSLIFALIVAPLGIVFGVMAHRQISREGGNGRGLATAGVVVGSLATLGGALLAVVLFIALTGLASSTSNPSSAGAQVVPSALVGSWEGQVNHRAGTPPQYTVQITAPPTRNTIEVSYPELGCSGTMTPQGETRVDGTLVVRETITEGRTGCVDQRTITLTFFADGKGLGYGFEDRGSLGGARLARTA